MRENANPTQNSIKSETKNRNCCQKIEIVVIISGRTYFLIGFFSVNPSKDTQLKRFPRNVLGNFFTERWFREVSHNFWFYPEIISKLFDTESKKNYSHLNLNKKKIIKTNLQLKKQQIKIRMKFVSQIAAGYWDLCFMWQSLQERGGRGQK